MGLGSFIRYLFSTPFIPSDTFIYSLTLLKAYVNSHAKKNPPKVGDISVSDGNGGVDGFGYGDVSGDGGVSGGYGDGNGGVSGDGNGGVVGNGGVGVSVSGYNVGVSVSGYNGGELPVDTTLYRALDLIISRLSDFKHLLIGEDRTRQGPYGLIHTCGRESIAVVEFLDSLIRANHRHVNSAIIHQDLISACFSVFFRCPLNNFYHFAVFKLVEGIFVFGDDDELKISVLKGSNLLNLILEGFQNCNLKDERGYCHGLYGYGGHLYQIAMIVSNQKSNVILAPLLEENAKWTEFEEGELVQMQLLYLPTEVWNKR